MLLEKYEVSPTEVLKILCESSDHTYFFYCGHYCKFVPEIYYMFSRSEYELIIKENKLYCGKRYFVFASSDEALNAAKILADKDKKYKIYSATQISNE